MEINQDFSNQLNQGIISLGLEISKDKQNKLIQYLEQLIKWNKAFNLSGLKDPNAMLKLHLLDSLSVVPFIDGEIILDVGTGAGLPGFVLAICFPKKHFILLDSNGKKTRFMFQTAAALGLTNIEVVNGRAEDFKTDKQIDIVMSRAFSSLRQFIEWTEHLIDNDNKLLAMKGRYPTDEVLDMPEQFGITQKYSLTLPDEEAERHLLEIKRL